MGWSGRGAVMVLGGRIACGGRADATGTRVADATGAGGTWATNSAGTGVTVTKLFLVSIAEPPGPVTVRRTLKVPGVG